MCMVGSKCAARGAEVHLHATMELLETRRLAFLAANAHNSGTGRARRKLAANTDMLVRKSSQRSAKPGAARVVRFIELLAEFGRAAWANKQFEVNELMLRRLAHSHLPLIAGEHYDAEKNNLEAIINSPDKSGNVVWVTNRQQGKTTTLSRFLAALIVLSPIEGSLVCVYSTNLDRATELLKGAKMYIMAMPKVSDVAITILANNERSLTVRTAGGATHSVAARPRNADSCRGDAPKAAIFDEIAFVSPDFWYQFAYPLLQVGRRVFTCATTPPHFGSFFSLFVDSIKTANAKGDNFFRLVNHGLVCAECEQADLAEKCAHRLYLVPPWKSVIRFWKMRTLVPENRLRDFEQEVYGVLRKQMGGYLPGKLVDAFTTRPALSTCCANRREPVYVSVDPPSHQTSFMGIAAVLWGTTGEISCLGAAEVSALHGDTLQLQSAVGDFLRQLRLHPWVGTFRNIVPVIETNNNSVLALSLLNVFKHHAPMKMPFVSRYFAKSVTANVGVLTTEENKHAMLQFTFSCLLDGRITHAVNAVTTGRAAFDRRVARPTFAAALTLLGTELKSMRDMPNGKISGKIQSGQGDDLAMAFMMGLYWGHCCRALGV